MTKIFKKVAPWILSAALCMLAAEIFGAAVFFHQDGALVYRNTPKVSEREVQAAAPPKPRLHPYFGYTNSYSLTNRARMSDNTNNLGFIQRFGPGQARLVPFKPEPNDFVVFVFGSSIAAGLVSAPRSNIPLRDNLQKITQLKEKNVVVYSMAQGPQKQPQQLIELAFLLALGQHIDLVLSVVGTVEFTSGLHNLESGIDPIFPHAGMLRSLAQELAPVDSSSTDYYELAFRLSRDRARVKLYSKLVAESTSGLGFLKNRFMLGYYSSRLASSLANYESTISRKNNLDGLLSLDMPVTVRDNVFDAIFQTWMRCSDLMKVMANSNGAAFLEIVHPNPYYSKRKLTQSEQAIMDLPETHYVPRGATEGYRLIEQRAEMLKSRGIVNALSLFDDVPEAVYEDSTGHFNYFGEMLFGQFVTDQVAVKLDSAGVKSQSSK